MGGAGWRTSLGRRTREAPSLHPSASQRRPERPGCSPGWFKSRGKPATTGAQPGARIPAAELPPCSAPRTQAQRSRPYPSRHIPARAAKPLPRTFPGVGAPAAEGLPSSAAYLRAGSRGRSEGRGAQASKARRLKLCCSRDGAVVTSSLNGWRGPGRDPAARAVARRALQPPAPPALRALGCRGKRAAVRRACTPLGEARSSRVVSAPKKCGRGCSQAGSGRWCWGSGTQSWGYGKNKGWGRRKVFQFGVAASRSCWKAQCSVFVFALFLFCFFPPNNA